MAATPERFIWAAEIMAIKPSDSILEIGCGTGLLAEVLAEKLPTGKFMAVDKSAAMTAKARKRNSRFIENGTSQFILSEFTETEFPEHSFDAIAAFNVNFFMKDSPAELALVKKLLRPDGLVYVFYQAPFEITKNAALPIKQQLEKNGFGVISVHLKKLLPTSAVCVVAKVL